MGNPTRYLGATMTWAGKQLKYWGKSGKYVNFAYNEDGIRTQKNSDGILTNYYYNGSLLIGMTVGSGSSANILRFSYDASGNVVAVDYSTDNGSTFNTYYYLRNAQNDIVKLIDNSCSGFVNEFDDIALGIAEVIVIISIIVHGNDFAVSVIAEAEL